MASVVKFSAIIVAVRVIWFSFEHVVAFWAMTIAWMAGASIVIGNLLALKQTRLRRLLAYSGISHAGFMAIGLLATMDEASSVGAVLFYALTYPLIILGLFAVLHTILYEEEMPDDSIAVLKGLFYRSPFMAVSAVLFLFSLAGLPPVMVGFLSKWYVLQVAWGSEYPWLVVVGLIFSVVGAAYYLKLVALIFTKSDSIVVKESEYSYVISQQRIVATILLIITLYLSIFPGGLSYYTGQVLHEVGNKNILQATNNSQDDPAVDLENDDMK